MNNHGVNGKEKNQSQSIDNFFDKVLVMAEDKKSSSRIVWPADKKSFGGDLGFMLFLSFCDQEEGGSSRLHQRIIDPILIHEIYFFSGQ